MIPLHPSWSVATRPAVGDDYAMSVAYRRYTRRDAIQAKLWAQAWGRGEEDGFLTVDLEAGELAAACEAMASRLLRWPSGEAWTDRELLVIHEASPGLWAWLYGLLFWPAIQGQARLEDLARALQIAPVTSCPGDPAATDCRVCLRVVHEPWEPSSGKRGRPVCAYPFERKLGDSICEACPKWDAVAGKPRPTLGAHDLALAGLLRDIGLTGALPDEGGLLDQDGDAWERMELIAASPWWRAHSGQ